MSRTLQVRCLVCGEILCYNRESTGPLINHLRYKHPFIHVARLPAYPDCHSDKVYLTGGLTKKVPSKSESASSDSLKKNERTKQEKRRRYRYTVEAWKPGTGKIVCPSCGAETSPIIRQRRSKMATNTVRACCLLGCWPLFFLPHFLCGSKVINLYCAHCSHFLGSFDRGVCKMVDQTSAISLNERAKMTTSNSAPNICVK